MDHINININVFIYLFNDCRTFHFELSSCQFLSQQTDIIPVIIATVSQSACLLYVSTVKGSRLCRNPTKPLPSIVLSTPHPHPHPPSSHFLLHSLPVTNYHLPPFCPPFCPPPAPPPFHHTLTLPAGPMIWP